MDLGTVDIKVISELMGARGNAVFVKGLDGRYQFINEAGAAMIHRSVGDVLGKSDFELFSSDSASVMKTRDEGILSEGAPCDYESTASHLNYTQTYRSTKAPFRDASGALIGLLGISRNVTALAERRARIQAQLNRAIAEIRHDLKNPITSSQLRLQLARRKLTALTGGKLTEAPSIDELVSGALTDVLRLASLIDETSKKPFLDLD